MFIWDDSIHRWRSSRSEVVFTSFCCTDSLLQPHPSDTDIIKETDRIKVVLKGICQTELAGVGTIKHHCHPPVPPVMVHSPKPPCPIPHLSKCKFEIISCSAQRMSLHESFYQLYIGATTGAYMLQLCLTTVWLPGNTLGLTWALQWAPYEYNGFSMPPCLTEERQTLHLKALKFQPSQHFLCMLLFNYSNQVFPHIYPCLLPSAGKTHCFKLLGAADQNHCDNLLTTR